MKTKKVDSLLAEIVNSQGFINIDQSDVDSFRAIVDEVDAEKVSGRAAEVGNLLDDTISTIMARNDGKQIKGLLFVIRFSQGNSLTDNINCVQDVIEKLGEELECRWGISTMDNLQDDQIELIVVVGF